MLAARFGRGIPIAFAGLAHDDVGKGGIARHRIEDARRIAGEFLDVVAHRQRGEDRLLQRPA